MYQSLAKKVCLPLLMAALVAGCGDKKDAAAGEQEVAAKVNGTELTVAQVDYALQRIPNLDQDQAKATSLKVVRNLVDQEVIAQKALADKLDSDPEVVQALDAARRQILVEAYMERKLGTMAEPTDAEVEDYFNQHPELFAERKIYRLQEIAIKAPQDKHEAIRKQLDASKNLNDFVAWLKAENLPAKPAQGVKAAEQLPLDILPKLAQMPVGQAMVANAPDGLLVIVMAGAQSQPVTLEQARPALARVLKAMARQKAAKAELDALKAAAKIEYLGDFAEAGKVEAAASEAADAGKAEAGPSEGATEIAGEGDSAPK